MSNKIPEFNPDDYPDKVCCGILEHLLVSGFEFPFTLPMSVSPAAPGDFNVQPRWAVRLYQKDQRTLGLNQAKSVTLFLMYCPFCGKKIGKE